MKDEVKLIHIDSEKLDKDEAEEIHALGYAIDEAFVLPIKTEERFRVIVNTLKIFLDKSDIGKKLDISEGLFCELHSLLSSLVYLSNSTSFIKGDKYYGFDRLEIDKKLGRNKRI